MQYWEAVVTQILCNWSREFIKIHQRFSFKTSESHMMYFFYFITKFSTACRKRDTLCLSSAKYQLKTFALLNEQEVSLWNLKNTAHVFAIWQRNQNQNSAIPPLCHYSLPSTAINHSTVKFLVTHAPQPLLETTNTIRYNAKRNTIGRMFTWLY